jgi:predicted DNA-binding transcriptional regulator AlpA
MAKRVQSATAQSQAINPAAFLRLKQIVPPLIPISRSAWWKGVRDGKYPAPVRLGPNTTAWRARDILEMIENLGREGDAPAAPAPRQDEPRQDDRPDPRLGVRGRRLR